MKIVEILDINTKGFAINVSNVYLRFKQCTNYRVLWNAEIKHTRCEEPFR